jgi:hypothetical protein
MSWLQKVIAGGPGRTSRLHTERGEIIPIRELRHVPKVATGKIRSLVTGRRPDEPWWPMSAIPEIEGLLTKSSKVIEFGSGGSTIWLSKRVGSVLAIEDDPAWERTVTTRLHEAQCTNAKVRFATGADYYDLSDFSEDYFDLAIVDGSYRWKCVDSVLSRVKSNGAIYLDNSDADKDKQFYPRKDMHHCAQSKLEQFAATNPKARLNRYVSFLNGELHAGEGMLLRMPGNKV